MTEAIAIFDTQTGKYAELHQYLEPRRDDDGFPDGFNEIWELYVFDNPDNKTEFKVMSFLCEYNAKMFLIENGYKEIVL